jgi:hypothetical protein
MKTKTLPCPERLRHVPRQFSWIDQRLVRNRHIQGPTPRALALYLFLCTVADAEGLSYYSDASTGALLTCSGSELRAARAELVATGLIVYQSPFYQVLSLEPRSAATVATAAEPRIGDVRSIGEIFRAMMEVPK